MKRIITLSLAAALTFSAAAQATPQWLRKSCISPDGKTIALAYQGDIFTVSAQGGTARQLTVNAAYDSDPIWTPDGKSIVFSSYRELSKDIYVMPAEGGAPLRLTTYSGNETPLAVSPDGFVYFIANIQQDPTYDGFPGDVQLYKVSLAGGRPKQVTSVPVSGVSVKADGTSLYEDYKGYEDPLRKHHTSSVTRDIWEFSPAAGTFRKLSGFAGEDRNPVWAADGDTYYYLSEAGGVLNVWRAKASDASVNEQVTNLPTHPVRHLSVAGDGTLLFSWNGGLYTCKAGGQPKAVGITIAQDEKNRKLIRRNLTGGASTLAVSPNGKEVAIVSHGDVYVTSIDLKDTRRITDTPVQERGVSFSEDGRTLYYASERDGHWAVYRSSLKNKEDKYFTFAYEFKEEQFSEGGQTCFQPEVSPDGKWVAFLRDRTELVIKAAKGGEEKSLLKGVNYSYSDGDQDFAWSPDSHYLLVTYQADGRWNNTDVALIDIETGKITDLTRSGYSDGDFHWAMKGKAMTWTSDKNGYRSHGSWGAEEDVYAMFFDGEAYRDFTRSEDDDKIETLLKDEKEAKKEEKKEKKDSVKAEKGKMDKTVLDLDRRDDRTVRLSRVSGMMGDHFLSPDGKKLYYCVRRNRTLDLYCLELKKGTEKVLQTSVFSPLIPDKDGKNIFFLGAAGLSKMDLNLSKITTVSFNAEFDYRPAEERAYIFEHCWKQVDEKFYDTAIHGVDWKGMHDNYVQFLPYIDNNFDFQDLLSEMLGELNGSHTGARYRGAATQLTTGRLGVLFDQDWEGASLKIAEVLPGGCLSVAYPKLAAGDEILAIDGKPVKAGQTWYDALFDKSGKRTLITLKHDGKTEKVYVIPTASDSDNLYTRWVRRREKMTEELSGGRIGYVHVQGMNSASFREVYSKALGRWKTCDALIVDTRHNGGGWLHDDLVTFLSGKAYIEFRPRGQYIGTEPYSKWTKPSCVLIGEDNYSDACGFPYAYKALGVGKLIGAPVPGTMTAVWWETQIDNSLVFGIPQVTSWGLDVDRALENYQIEPDIRVDNDPGSVAKGFDRQLEAAVKEMMK